MTACRTGQPEGDYRAYFDPATEPGTHVEVVLTGPNHVTMSAGTYVGVRDSGHRPGTPYHYFSGGYVGEVPQPGLHGFPVAQATGFAYHDRRALITTTLDPETDQRSIVLVLVDHDSDLQNVTEEVVIAPPTPPGGRGTPLEALLAIADLHIVMDGHVRFGGWEVGVGTHHGIFAEARVTPQVTA